MPFDFYQYLRENKELKNMPPIEISIRKTDKYVTYNKNFNRLDKIAGEIYEDETLGKIILWANPEYYYEYDIPDNTVIRIPFPEEDVISEIVSQIIVNKDLI